MNDDFFVISHEFPILAFISKTVDIFVSTSYAYSMLAVLYKSRKYLRTFGTINLMPQNTIVEKSLKTLNASDEIAEFANNVDLDEVAHDEPPHLELHCLPSL